MKEATKGRKRDLGEKTWSLAESVRHAAQVVGVFVLFTLLWTMWSSASIDEFLSLMKIAGSSSLLSWLAVLGGLSGLILIGVTFQYLNSRGIANHVFVENTSSYRSKISLVVGSLLLLVIGQPASQELLNEDANMFMATVQFERLNQQDQELQERGYYEELLSGKSFTSALQQSWKPKDWNQEGLYTEFTDDLYAKTMIPMSNVVDRGVEMQINQWGMRDLDYSQDKAAGTYRIALMGASHVMGVGVEEGKNFESILEKELNAASSAQSFEKYEVLNFSVTAYGLLQQVFLNEDRLPAFDPDAVFYVAHPGEIARTMEKLVSRVEKGSDLFYPFLKELVAKADVDNSMSRTEIARLLEPYNTDLVNWGYKKLVEEAQFRGDKAVWVLMPLLGEENERVLDENEQNIEQFAKDAGFYTINLQGVYDAYPYKELIVAPWDMHPNAVGHRLVAERLFEEIKELDNQLGMGLTAGSRITDINQPNETVLKTD